MNNTQDLQVSVSNYQEDPHEADTILYEIQCTYLQGKSWILLKRFSQFDDLQKQLKEYFLHDLPQMPKKSYITFFVGKTQDDLEQRRLGLDNFLKQIVAKQEVCCSVVLRTFLELDKHTSQNIIGKPKLIGDFKGFVHGVRDFTLDATNGLLFIVNSDMNVITRLDAYVSNMKMPWESEKGQSAVVSVGVVECWIRNANGDYKRSWTKNYNSQAICVYWDQATQSLLVGLDSGFINLLIVAKDFKSFDESMEIEIHNERIMGVYFRDGLIHSISKDKKYRVMDLSLQSLVADIEPGQFDLTYLLIDEDRKKSFVGNRCGSIYIYDLEKSQPKLVVHLKTTLKFVRGLCVDSVKCFLFAVGQDEGELIVFDINKPGRESEAKEVANLKNRSRSKEICWSGSRGEIFVGNEDGTVTVWDAKKATPIYVWKAHTDDVTKLVWLESDITLLSGGKDRSIKAWKLPAQWMDQSLIEKDEKLVEQIHKTQRINNIEDDDDLVSWHK